jgi:hypothetical protein
LDWAEQIKWIEKKMEQRNGTKVCTPAGFNKSRHEQILAKTGAKIGAEIETIRKKMDDAEAQVGSLDCRIGVNYEEVKA